MLTKTEQKVLDILAANPDVWVPNVPRTMPGVRCSTMNNLIKKGLVKQGRDSDKVIFGYKLAQAPDSIDSEIDALNWEPHPEDPDASKADAEIISRRHG